MTDNAIAVKTDELLEKYEYIPHEGSPVLLQSINLETNLRTTENVIIGSTFTDLRLSLISQFVRKVQWDGNRNWKYLDWRDSHSVESTLKGNS